MTGSDARVAVIFLVICVGLGIAFRGELLTAFSSNAPSDGHVAPGSAAFADVYKKLKIAPLSPDVSSMRPIASALNELANSECDKSAVFRLSSELAKVRERRTAANVLLGFADACPNSEGELSAAANMLFGIGDYNAVIPVTDRLVALRPEASQYYYLRGQAMNFTQRPREAIEDFSSAIALFDDIKLVGSQVFEQLASAYAADGKHCQAMTAIQTFVNADAATRDTAKSRKLIADYAAKGGCAAGYADGSETIPRASKGVTIANVSVNGVSGRFVIDSGASVVTVDSAFAEKAKISTVNSRKILTYTANGVADATLTTAASVAVGKVRAENVSTSIISKSIGPGIDGLLGMSFLARFDVTLGERAIRIQARKAPVAGTADAE